MLLVLLLIVMSLLLLLLLLLGVLACGLSWQGLEETSDGRGGALHGNKVACSARAMDFFVDGHASGLAVEQTNS